MPVKFTLLTANYALHDMFELTVTYANARTPVVEAALGNKIVNMHASAHIDELHQQVTMLFAIQPGPALRSYGINVAQAVRFPEEIVTEARALEARLLGAGQG
jgi:DNA mismatch repair ATPase MutS